MVEPYQEASLFKLVGNYVTSPKRKINSLRSLRDSTVCGLNSPMLNIVKTKQEMGAYLKNSHVIPILKLTSVVLLRT